MHGTGRSYVGYSTCIPKEYTLLMQVHHRCGHGGVEENLFSPRVRRALQN